MSDASPDWAVVAKPVPPELLPGFPHADPPDHIVNPDDIDEDVHPTSAWAVGERLDDDTLAALRALFEGQA